MEREHILPPSAGGENGAAYKLLRTQVLRRLDQLQANTLAVISPAAAAGKTLTESLGVLLTNKEARPPADISRYLHFEDIIVKIAGRPVGSAQTAATDLAALPLERWNEITVIRPGHAQ